jgi:uncharacterized protein (TIGR00369 family)
MAAPDELKSAFSKVPVNKLLSFSLESCSSEQVVITMPAEKAFTQEEGVIHGGIITALADTTAVYLLHPDLPAGKTMTSIELKMNFLRPAFVGGDDLRAKAKLVKRGQTVSVCEVDVYQGDRTLAKGLFTYLISEKSE